MKIKCIVNYFKLCFDVFLSLIGGFAESVKRAIQPSFERVNALRHNVYDQLSHIQDDFKSLLSFEDISLKDWPEIVSFSNNRILSNCEVASKTILRTLKRVAIALCNISLQGQCITNKSRCKQQLTQGPIFRTLSQ